MLVLVPSLLAPACRPIDRPEDGHPTAPPVPVATTPTHPAPTPSLAPTLEAVPATTLPVPTATGLPPISGFSVNARVHPHGVPTTWWVEYGPSLAQRTDPRALPGRLDAHFAEDWAGGLHGWEAGFSGVQGVPMDTGGPDGGPFVRYTDDGGAGNDVNHYDGIGIIHLGPYAYLGNYYWAYVPPMYLGGGFPDLRGARVSLWLRGVDWVPRGTDLGTWIQSYQDPSVVEEVPYQSRYPNWAFTGDPQGGHLASGDWEPAGWTLRNRTSDWTFSGAYGGRLLYDYGELESALAGVNVDFFVWQILHVDLVDPPTGSIDTADLQLTYRQHSLLAPTNGGSLVAEPAGGTAADRLTDGWPHGADHEWQSADDPVGPQTFVYAFADPVVVYSVNLRNATEDGVRDARISVSADGGSTWTAIAEGEVPQVGELGPNYAFFHADAWELAYSVAVWAPLYDGPVDQLKVEIVSGWGDGAWKLGEIEAFGTGSTEATDDDWYDANVDVLVQPGTWSYRVVAENADGTTVGEEQEVEVP